MKKNRIINGIMLILAILIVISAAEIWRIIKDYRQGEKTYAALAQYAVIPDTSAGTEATAQQPNAQTPAEAEASAGSMEAGGDWPQVDFASLQDINPDVIGWIYIEGTDINYPIVQGKENNDYLRRMFDGTPNHAGSIFLDSRCNAALTDSHSIIYGHHMKNTTMFSELEQYKQQAFFDNHTWGWLITPEAHYKLQFFAGYVAETDADAWDLELEGEKRQTWIDHAIAQSCFQSGIVPDEAARIVTLSTCSYDFSDARFVLHGILVE